MVLPHLSAVRTQGKANVAQLVEQLIRNRERAFFLNLSEVI